MVCTMCQGAELRVMTDLGNDLVYSFRYDIILLALTQLWRLIMGILMYLRYTATGWRYRDTQ